MSTAGATLKLTTMPVIAASGCVDQLIGRRRDVAGHGEDDRQRRRAEREPDRLARRPHAAERAGLARPVRALVVRDDVGQHRHGQRLHARVRDAGDADGHVDPVAGRPQQRRGSTAPRRRRRCSRSRRCAPCRCGARRRPTRARRSSAGAMSATNSSSTACLGVQHPRRDVLRAREHESGRERLQHEGRQQRAERAGCAAGPGCRRR